MKKIVLLLIITLCLSFIVTAQDPGVNPTTEGIKKIAEKLPINTETGEIGIDQTTTKTWIEKINNALGSISWLDKIFNIKPEVSWLFAINILVIILVLDVFVFVLPKFNFIPSISEKFSMLIGALIFLFLHLSKITLKLAELLNSLAIAWWAKVVFIAVLIFFLALLEFIRGIGSDIGKKRKEERERKKTIKTAESEAKMAVEKELKKGETSKGSEEKEIEKEADQEAKAIASMTKED